MTDRLLTPLRDYQSALAAKIGAIDTQLGRLQRPGQMWYKRSPTAVLRARLILEEAQELADALLNGEDEAALVKEEADLAVVLFGTAVVFDHPIYPAFDAVTADNYVRLERGTVRADGKLIKPVDHPKLDLKALLA